MLEPFAAIRYRPDVQEQLRAMLRMGAGKGVGLAHAHQGVDGHGFTAYRARSRKGSATTDKELMLPYPSAPIRRLRTHIRGEAPPTGVWA